MKHHSSLAPELLGALSNLVCVIENERITYINTAGMHMLAATNSDDVINHQLSEFVHTDYAEFIDLGIKAFAEEDGIPLKFLPMHAQPIDVHMRVRILETSDDEAYMVECKDISNYIKASQEARQREQRLAGVLGTVMDAIITLNEDGIIQTINPRTEVIFGYAKMDLIGHHINMLLPTEHRNYHEQCVTESLNADKSSTYGTTSEMHGQTSTATLFPIELSVTELHEGLQRLFTWVIRDITKRKKAQADIEHMAHHDALTGLPNRNLFNDLMDRAVRRAQRAKHLMAVLFVDLDKFKPVNDDFGHDAGDAVLVAVAERITSHIRTSDTVARIGGDEFVAILEPIDQWESAAKVAQKIIASLTEPIDISDGRQAQVGASIGISVYPNDGTTAAQLIRAADEAMYAVKAEGRNNYKFFKHVKPTK